MTYVCYGLRLALAARLGNVMSGTGNVSSSAVDLRGREEARAYQRRHADARGTL